MAKNTGIPYEKLAQQVFNEILNQNGVDTIQVKHDVTLQGKTGKHQIDVYWEFEMGGIKYTTIVQAKDWSSPVGQGEIILFKGVLDDLPGQPRGIFVTRTGYQSGAKEIGQAHGIGMYELRPPTDKDWDGKIKTIILQLHVLSTSHTNIKCVPDDAWIVSEKMRLGIDDNKKFHITFSGMATEMFFYDESGTPKSSFAGIIEKLSPKEKTEEKTRREYYNFSEPTFMLTNDVNFPKMKILSVEADVTHHVDKREIKIDGGEVVGLILRDIMSGSEKVFDKSLNLRKPT